MRKFRKKPVVIEAVQWNGENLKEVISFTGLHESARKWTWLEYEEVVKREGLKIFTLEGAMMANVGDWIIKGVHGEFYPCKPDIFEKTYEEADSFQWTDKLAMEYCTVFRYPTPSNIEEFKRGSIKEMTNEQKDERGVTTKTPS